MDDFVTDASGRKLALRKLNVMDQVRLMRAVGADQSRNEVYFNIVTMAASVSDIDGVPCMIPKNEGQIDGLIMRIGDEGFAALTVNMRKEFEAFEAAALNAVAGEGAEPSPLSPPA